MTETVFYVEKGTDQMRSTLLAYGLAALLYQIPPAGSGVDVGVRDVGSVYQVRASVGPEALLRWVQTDGRLKPLLPAIVKPLSERDRKREADGEPVVRKYQPQGFPEDKVVKYADEKAKPDGLERKGQPRIEGDVDVRHPDFPLWAHLCSYFGKGSAMRVGYPLVVHAWHAHQGAQAVDLFRLILDCFTSLPNDIQAASAAWLERIQPALAYPDFNLFNWTKQAEVSALSVISPTTAQGAFTVTGAKNINTDTPNIFWLEVYLAFAGYMAVGMPYRSGGDALLYYPLPREIAFVHARNIVAEYRKTDQVRRLYSFSNSLPRVKVDALSQIAFYRSMVKHFRQNLQDADAPPWEQARINAFNGFVGYYYKDISTQIPFDETTFALPPWLPAEANAETLDWAQQVLDAHHALINGLHGDHADELVILNAYRHFITLGDPDDWVAFAVAYGKYHFTEIVDSPWLANLTDDVLFQTLTVSDQGGAMNDKSYKDYRGIWETPGFLNIAKAIRSCTVQLRYFKDVKKTQSPFRVRHGLGDDLMRRAHNADDFIEDLGHYVHDYQRESSNVQANDGHVRPFITEDDLREVIELIPQYGSRVLASLLVAAGYASKFESKHTGGQAQTSE